MRGLKELGAAGLTTRSPRFFRLPYLLPNCLLPSAYCLLLFHHEARALRGAGLGGAVDCRKLEDVAAGGEGLQVQFGHVWEAREVLPRFGAELAERGGEDRLVVAENLHLERHVRR